MQVFFPSEKCMYVYVRVRRGWMLKACPEICQQEWGIGGIICFLLPPTSVFGKLKHKTCVRAVFRLRFLDD